MDARLRWAGVHNNALDIALGYTTAFFTVQAVITACTVVQAVLTVWTVVSCSNKFNTKLANLVMAVGLREHLKNYAEHVHRTTYYVL